MVYRECSAESYLERSAEYLCWHARLVTADSVASSWLSNILPTCSAWYDFLSVFICTAYMFWLWWNSCFASNDNVVYCSFGTHSCIMIEVWYNIFVCIAGIHSCLSGFNVYLQCHCCACNDWFLYIFPRSCCCSSCCRHSMYLLSRCLRLFCNHAGNVTFMTAGTCCTCICVWAVFQFWQVTAMGFRLCVSSAFQICCNCVTTFLFLLLRTTSRCFPVVWTYIQSPWCVLAWHLSCNHSNASHSFTLIRCMHNILHFLWPTLAPCRVPTSVRNNYSCTLLLLCWMSRLTYISIVWAICEHNCCLVLHEVWITSSCWHCAPYIYSCIAKLLKVSTDFAVVHVSSFASSHMSSC